MGLDLFEEDAEESERVYLFVGLTLLSSSF